jgi:hypothetical protein
MITFGKYKNRTFEYVLEHNIEYCNWCISQLENNTSWTQGHRQCLTDLIEFIKKDKEKKMITFGKYKNKTFDYVLNKDIGYCNWCISEWENNSPWIQKETPRITDFINFIIKKRWNMIPTGQINCSQLSPYYYNYDKFMCLLNNLHIQIKKLNNITFSNTQLPSNINGIYIDYFIRYKICSILKREFNDHRCNFIRTACSILNMNDINKLPCYLKQCIDFDKYLYDEDGRPVDEHSIQKELSQVLHDKITEIIEKSYRNMKNYTANYNDILNVSLCHSLFFGETQAYYYFNYFDKNYHYDDGNLQEYFQAKMSNNEDKVLCNPTLGSMDLKLGADADLIIDKELLDIKCSSRKIGENMNDFIQLFIYASLYYKQTGIKCKKLTILNPILNYEKYIELTNWDEFDNILELLALRVS